MHGNVVVTVLVVIFLLVSLFLTLSNFIIFLSQEKHQLPFKDVGAITNVYVALVKKGEGPPANKRSIETAEKRKRFFGANGWTLESVSISLEHRNIQPRSQGFSLLNFAGFKI